MKLYIDGPFDTEEEKNIIDAIIALTVKENSAPAENKPVENRCNIDGEPRESKTTEEINAELIEENRRLRDQLKFSRDMEEKYGNLINNLLEMLSSSGIQVKVRHD